jgi:DNA invertase Pin-like site-specific DNA recombinase
MSALLVGYARCSTDQQDLTAQRDALSGLGVQAERIYVDHGLTGTNRERPGLREALAACRAGDTLVVTKLDRLAKSLPDARAIADELTARQISLSVGGSVNDPTDAVGRLLFNVLAMVAEFESDLIRLRTVEGMKVAKAKGRLHDKQPKLNRDQEAHLVSLAHWRVQHPRSCGALWRRPLHRLPSHRTPTGRSQGGPRGGFIKAPTVPHPAPHEDAGASKPPASLTVRWWFGWWDGPRLPTSTEQVQSGRMRNLNPDDAGSPPDQQVKRVWRSSPPRSRPGREDRPS